MSQSKKDKTNQSKENIQDPGPVKNFDTNDLKQFEQQADKERTRKPGSQSNASDQHNNGRGGGK